MTYGDFFKGKKIAVVGLGPEGQLRADVKFLLGSGSIVTMYDMRGKPLLSRLLSDMKSAGLSSWRLGFADGRAWADELAGFDLIIMDPHMPRSADFLRQARNKGIPIEYPDILALKLSPAVTVVGVMGSSGKTAIMYMLGGALRRGFSAANMTRPVVLDMESSSGALALLPKIRKDGVVIVRIPDFLLAEYARARQSPQIAVMASLPAVPEPFVALAHQTHNNFFITTDEIADRVHAGGEGVHSKIIRTRRSRLPADWHVPLFGDHEREDAALVVEAAALFKVSESACRMSIEEYAAKKQIGGVRPVKKVKGVEFYNDAGAEGPEATLAALRSISEKMDDTPISSGLILIMGGAETMADYGPLLKGLPNYARTVVLVPGSGTASLRKSLNCQKNLTCLSAPSLESAVKLARSEARPGDRVLYSPAFAAAGVDASRSARSERFVKAVRGLW